MRSQKSLPFAARSGSYRGAPVGALIALALVVAESMHAGMAPTIAVTLHPGDDLALRVEQSPPGTEFHLETGVYRLASMVPKDGDAFIGDSGATLNGAVELTQFSRSGRFWTARVDVQEAAKYRGECWDTSPLCTFPTDLYMDSHPLARVAALDDLKSGQWYLDSAAQIAYFTDDPNGHAVEMSRKPFAIRSDASNVRVEGLTVEKYACAAGDAAIDARAENGHLSRNWIVKNNMVTLNHGVGIRLGDGIQVLENRSIENGQLGIAGAGEGGLVDGNEIARNNYAGYKYDWEAGGSKFAFTRDLTVRNNDVHDNDGPGLWTDLENENTLYEHNHTHSNRGAGIQHEVSYKATIRDNLIENDGSSDYHQTAPWYGAGIVIAGSADVEVYGNTVKDCMNGIIGTQPRREPSRRGTPYELRNLNVHDNTIFQTGGTAAGIVRSGGLSDDVFDSWNNRFTDNHFHLSDAAAKFFAWKGEQLSLAAWHAQMHP
jgi:hypothetical protein